ncbi:hypothetical protein L1987_08957 [Smallanthus sonchifolius]|uniref:Uncharacterized protein n=1 Tax=Smallanthus sonchifolius TaxID=185202 RepID=A0ACB9JP44_9ASTR|nr:hypothetical protein L1987_08957 [Smallanthus sonchifolius]
MQFVLSFNGYKIIEKNSKKSTECFIVCTSDILSVWCVSVVQQKVVSGYGYFCFCKAAYPQQLWSSADKDIRSRFVLQQKNKYPLQISLSASVCWSAANSEISSICT